MVSLLTNKCLEQPTLLDKLQIDLHKHRVIERLPILVDPGEEYPTLVSVTQSGYYCLEDIFSVQGWDLKKTSLNAVSICTQTPEESLIIKYQKGETYAHRLIALEVTRFRSPSLSVIFNMMIDKLLFKNVSSTKLKSFSGTVNGIDIKAHPLYRALLLENQKLKRLNLNATKQFHKFGKDKAANYVVFYPDAGHYKMGESINIDNTLSTYRKGHAIVQVVVIVYHNRNPEHRIEFERCISRKFSEYHIKKELYGKGLSFSTIHSI